jgi:hypothetical protein
MRSAKLVLVAILGSFAGVSYVLTHVPSRATPHRCASCSEGERARTSKGQHCGCPASEGACSLPCSSCCAPVCTGIEGTRAAH